METKASALRREISHLSGMFKSLLYVFQSTPKLTHMILSRHANPRKNGIFPVATMIASAKTFAKAFAKPKSKPASNAVISEKIRDTQNIFKLRLKPSPSRAVTTRKADSRT